jgi:hypothetical protein
MMNNKKAQTPEFIGIIILVIVIAVFAMFARVNSSSTAVRESEETLREYQTLRFLLISKVFPYVTINNIPIEQLLGVYMCYNNETVDYGSGAINITQGIKGTLDYAVGQDLWALQIGDTICMKSKTIEPGQCTIPSNKKYKAHEFAFGLPCFVGVKKGILFAEQY